MKFLLSTLLVALIAFYACSAKQSQTDNPVIKQWQADIPEKPWQAYYRYAYDPNISCENFTFHFSSKWQMDSLGSTGFRRLAVKELFDRCELKGKHWNSYEDFFGTPDRIYDRPDRIHYIFDLTDYGRYNREHVMLHILFSKPDSIIYLHEVTAGEFYWKEGDEIKKSNYIGRY